MRIAVKNYARTILLLVLAEGLGTGWIGGRRKKMFTTKEMIAQAVFSYIFCNNKCKMPPDVLVIVGITCY